MSVQVLLGIGRVKFITLLTGVRLVPVLGSYCLLLEHTVPMGSAVASGLMLFTLYRVRLEFLARILRDQLTFSISTTRLLVPLFIGGRLLGFTICVPPVVPGLKVTKQVDPLFGRNVAIAAIIFLNFLLNCCG